MNRGYNAAKITADLCRFYHESNGSVSQFRELAHNYFVVLNVMQDEMSEKLLSILKQFRGAVIRSRDVEYPQKLRDSYFQKLCKKGWVKRIGYGTYELTESGRAYLLSRGYPDPTCNGWSV